MNMPSTAAWVPALFGMLVICAESTRIMGADHTMLWLSRLCAPLLHLPSGEVFQLNHVLRKCGHFLGYGSLGLVFMQGWLALLLRRMHSTWTRIRMSASGFAIASVALVASMDELHQSFLPNRTASVSDVLLDTSGAILLVGLVTLVLLLRRKRMLTQLLALRTIRQWKEGMWLFRDALLEQPR